MEALTSKQGKSSVDTAYPLSQILALFGAGKSIFAFMIPPAVLILLPQIACLAHFFLITPSVDTAYPLSQIFAVVGAGRSTFAFMIPPQYSYVPHIACLAHFILVLGRFTGIESSHCSFLNIKHWLVSHL